MTRIRIDKRIISGIMVRYGIKTRMRIKIGIRIMAWIGIVIRIEKELRDCD